MQILRRTFKLSHSFSFSENFVGFANFSKFAIFVSKIAKVQGPAGLAGVSHHPFVEGALEGAQV